MFQGWLSAKFCDLQRLLTDSFERAKIRVQCVLFFQTKVRELQDKGQEAKVDSTPTIEFDFKAKFAEAKATAKVSSYSYL